MITLNEFLYGLGQTKVIITNQDERIIFPLQKMEVTYCENIVNQGTPNEDGNFYFYNKIWYDVESFVLRCQDGLYNIQMFKDISKYVANDLEVQTDVVTNLPNRKLINKLICQLIEESISFNTSFAIAMCDIDWFKKINDTYGHECGDFVLKIVSNIFLENTRQYNIRGKRVLRGRDVVGRYGGEEFIFGFNNMIFEQAYNKLEKIRRTIAETEINYNGVKFQCPTASFGLYWVNSNSFSTLQLNSIEEYKNELINKSDKALYQSKIDGRNRITVVTEQND